MSEEKSVTLKKKKKKEEEEEEMAEQNAADTEIKSWEPRVSRGLSFEPGVFYIQNKSETKLSPSALKEDQSTQRGLKELLL